jgi:hypothetical protein
MESVPYTVILDTLYISEVYVLMRLRTIGRATWTIITRCPAPSPLARVLADASPPPPRIYPDHSALFQARYTPLISGFWSVIVHCTISRHFQPSPLPQNARISGMRVKQQSTFPSAEISIVWRGRMYGLESSARTLST